MWASVVQDMRILCGCDVDWPVWPKIRASCVDATLLGLCGPRHACAHVCYQNAMGADVHAWVCTVIGFAGAVFHCGLCGAVRQFGLSALFSCCSLDVGHEGCVQGVSRSAGYVKGIVSYQSAFFVDATLLSLCGPCLVLAACSVLAAVARLCGLHRCWALV